MKRKIFTPILFLIIALFISTTASAYVIKGLEREIETVDVTINSKHYVLMIDICEANGIEWKWDSISRSIILQRGSREVIFLIGSKYYYDGEKFKGLSAPVIMKNGFIYMPRRFAKYTINRLFALDKRKSRIPDTPEKETKETKKITKKRYIIKKVIIDPGHGGKDPGAVSRTGLYEKNVVLDVSKRIKKELEKNGMDVVMTRDSDKFITLSRRAKIANDNDADLFVSIHANANRARWIRGFEVYYLSEATDDNARALAASENSVLKYEEESFAKHTKDLDAIVWDLKFTEHRVESIELADFICQGVAKNIKLKNRGIKSARFYVLKYVEMPSVLVELSYLSNKWDEKNLKKSSYKQKLAEGIASGIINYKGEYERTNGFSR